MSSAGTVTVDFAAEVSKFNAQMKTVNDRVARVESGFKSLQKVAEAALKFLSVGIAARFVQSAGEAADAIGKMADKLGLSTERLVAFQLAAELAGTPVETLNKLLADAERNLGQASKFKGSAFPAIEQLGLDIRELQKLTPDELFLRYADALNTVTNRSEKFALAQGLFGKSVQEAFSLVEAGRPAIEEAAKDVDRLGLALSRVDTAKIEAANDAITRLEKTSQAVGQHVAAAFAPFTEEVVKRLTEAGGAANKAQGDLELFAQGAFIAFNIVANAANTFDVVVSGAFAAIAKGNELLFASLRKGLEFTSSIDRALHLDSLAQTFDRFSQQVGEAESFSAALAENAVARVKSAANGIKSFAQIFAEADQIVAKSQSNAEEVAAKAGENSANLGLVSGPEQLGEIKASQAAIEELQTQHFDILLEQQLQYQARAGELSNQLDRDQFLHNQQFRVDALNKAEAAMQAAREQAASSAIGLLQVLAGKSKAAAIALVLINKSRAIAEAIQNTEVAATNALAFGDPYTAPARAAAIRALGYLSVAAIAATGFAEIQQVRSSSGGGASLGSPVNPVFTDTGGSDSQTFGAQQKSQISITVEGVVTPGAARAIADALKDVIDNADVHIIGENSSQAMTLRGG